MTRVKEAEQYFAHESIILWVIPMSLVTYSAIPMPNPDGA